MAWPRWLTSFQSSTGVGLKQSTKVKKVIYMKIWQPKPHPSQNNKPSNMECLDSTPSRPFKG